MNTPDVSKDSLLAVARDAWSECWRYREFRRVFFGFLAYAISFFLSKSLGWDHVATALFFIPAISVAVGSAILTFQIIKSENDNGIFNGVESVMFMFVTALFFFIAYSSHDIATASWGAWFVDTVKAFGHLVSVVCSASIQFLRHAFGL
jgi:hypothetical protein